MTDTNYPVEALGYLLDRSCLSERYFPLLPFKTSLLARLPLLGCRRKNDAAALPDEALKELGMDDPALIRLFRRFLSLYDPDPRKFREIDKLCSDKAERSAFRELYQLPGVKYIRASLYCSSGYRALEDLARTTPEEVLEKTALTITENRLPCTAPLPKEVRTHIAVARAFTGL